MSSNNQRSEKLATVIYSSLLAAVVLLGCFLYWVAVSWRNGTYKVLPPDSQIFESQFENYGLPFHMAWIKEAGQIGWLDSVSYFIKMEPDEGFDYRGFEKGMLEKGAVLLPKSFTQYEEDYRRKQKSSQTDVKMEKFEHQSPSQGAHKVAFHKIGLIKPPFMKTPFENWWSPGGLSDLRVLYFRDKHHKLTLSYSATDGLIYMYWS